MRQSIEADSRFLLRGWITVPTGTEEDASLLLKIDDGAHLPVRTKVDREIGRVNGEALTRLKFTSIYPPQLYDGRQHDIELLDGKSNEILFEGKKEFKNLQLGGSSAGGSLAGGVHFVAKAGHVEGWALDKKNPQRTVSLELFVDGDLVAHDLANLTSPNMLVGSESRYGFRIQIPNIFVDDQDHRFEVRADGVTLPAIQDIFRINIQSAVHHVDGLSPFYARFDGVGFEYLKGLVKTDARNNAHLALCVGDKVVSRAMLNQSLEQGAVEVRLKVPDELYDGKRRTLTVRVDTAESQTVIHSAARIMTPKLVDQARLVSLGVRAGRLKGKIAVDNQWVLEGGIGLFAGGVRVASGELSSRRRSWGDPVDFDLELSALASMPWLSVPVELALVQPGAQPIDVMPYLLGATSVSTDAGVLKITPPIPLNGKIQIGLARTKKPPRIVEVSCAGSEFVVVALDPTDEIRQPGITLNGMSLSGAPTARSQRRALSSAHVKTAVDPNAPDVRQAVEDVRFGGTSKPQVRHKGKASGAWELAPPHRIVGWAVDLEDTARILAVSLVVDGAQVGIFPANAANVSSAADGTIHRGFSIDLARVDVAAGLRSVEVRFTDTPANLYPQAPIQLFFPGRSASSSHVDETDRLVDIGKVDQAYARSAVGQDDDPALVVRRLVLDALMRPEWSCYDQSVDHFKSSLDQEQIARIKRLRTIIPDGDVGEFDEAISWLNLPPSYAVAFEQRIRAAQEKAYPDFASAYARWVVAAHPRRSFPTANLDADRIVLLDLTGATDRAVPERSDGVVHVRLSEETRASLAEGGSISPAAAEDMHKAVEGAAWALVFSKPRFIPDGVRELWLSLALGNDVCDVTLVPGEIGPDGIASRELDRWSAFVDARSFDALVAAAQAATIGKAHCLRRKAGEARTRGELTILKTGSAAIATKRARYLCIHDFADDETLPAAPLGVEMVRSEWATQGGLPTRDQIVESAALLQDGWNGGVIVLSGRISYPKEYVSDCIRHFERYPGGITFCGMNYDKESSKFLYGSYNSLDESSLALLPLGCFPLSLLAGIDSRGPLGELRILDADQPFRVVRLRTFPDNRECDEIFRDLAEGCSPSEHQSGFRSALRERHFTSFWRFQSLVEPPKLPGLDDAMRAMAGDVGLGSAVGHLERGQVEEAQAVIRFFIARHDFLVADQAPVLKLALALVKLSGQQDVLMDALLPAMPELVEAYPDLIMELFENAAFVLDPEELAALVISCAGRVLSIEETAPTTRLVDACRRYCGEKVMIILLSMIDRSERRKLLTDRKIRRIVGDAFSASEGSPFQLANTRLGRDDFKAASAKDVRLVASLLGGRRAEFLQVLNEMIAEAGDLRKIARTLRTYTNELSELQIRGREIAYPSARSLDEILQLALIVGDLETVSSHMVAETGEAGVQPDPLSIVWRSSQNDYGPLNEALRVWYSPFEVAPLRLAGGDVGTLFASVFEGHTLPTAPSLGRASIICTVFNPDLDLLKVSLDSMRAQTYEDLEIILIDDASDPEFARGIEEASALDPRIRYLRMSRNAGPYHGRNCALEIATGDFIAIQDGDDVAHPQRLELQVNALAKEPAYQMSTTGHLRIDTRGQVQFEHTLDLVGDGTMTSMFRRSLFDQVGGFAQVRSRGDVEFRERVRRAFGQHVISHAAAPLLFCLASPGSLSNHTAARYGSYLSLYRDGFAKRVVRSVIDTQACGSSDATLHVPYPLRSTTPR